MPADGSQYTTGVPLSRKSSARQMSGADESILARLILRERRTDALSTTFACDPSISMFFGVHAVRSADGLYPSDSSDRSVSDPHPSSKHARGNKTEPVLSCAATSCDICYNDNACPCPLPSSVSSVLFCWAFHFIGESRFIVVLDIAPFRDLHRERLTE